MDDITLINGDCLDEMKNIPDKSIDMILCDLPYGITDNEWDIVIPFEPLWEQYKRIISLCGAIVLFGNQPFTSDLIASNRKWYSHCWIWEKDNTTFHLFCNQQPMRKHEDISVFYRYDNRDINNFIHLRSIFRDIFTQINKPKTLIQKELGSGYDHCFRTDSAQFELPTEEKFCRMIDTYDINCPYSYDELYLEYQQENQKYRRKYTPQMVSGRYPHTILQFPRDLNGVHPTQKPVALCEYLIKTYTDEGDIVLDNCMGSGTTGVACKNTGRKFIGIEKDRKYFEIAEKRIDGETVKSREDSPFQQISIDGDWRW